MNLLEPLVTDNLNLKNRVIMAPLTRCRADNDEFTPTDLHATYYAQRAGAGLIISEATIVDPHGRGYLNTPGIYSKAQVDGWKLVTDAVHKNGGKIFCQLWHVGRLSHSDFHSGKLPLAPSPINPEIFIYTQNGKQESETPKELSREEISKVVTQFQTGARNAMEAGFDGIEIHSSNGYLLHQFFNSKSNQRTDDYGGNDENRARILFEVIDAIKEVMPENKIALRLNPMLHGAMGIEVNKDTASTFEYIVKRLNDYNLAYLHVTRPFQALDIPHSIKDVVGHFRALYKGTYLVNGNYNRESGETEIEDSRADAIVYGRPFISNPDLPDRFENDWPLAEWDKYKFYTPGPEGYTDYPAYED